MTSVSSFRPFKDSEEVARNQLRAKQSWEQVFDEIIYFGSDEPKLASVKTMFVDSKEFPTIDLLITAASFARGWVAILNADIVVSKALGAVVAECIRRNVRAITSKRYEFEPDAENMDKAKVKDAGYDFFMADAKMWAGAAQHVPSGYRIGHNRWDNWVLGYFNVICGRQFVDVTSRKVVFHPRHGERKQPYHIEVPNDRFLQLGRPPFYKLT